MIYFVEISTQAERDLRSIYEYIAFELQSVQNAKEQLDRLEESICGLDQMPERYRRYEKEPWYSRGWRIMPIDHYCIFYVPDHDHKIVNIVRILYGGRNMKSVLDGSEEA